MAGSVIGVSPKDGTLNWSLEHKNRFGTSIMTPIWCPNNMLYFANGGDEIGGRMVRLKRNGDKITTEEIWSNKKISAGMSNPVLIDGRFYGGSGSRQAPVMIGFDAKDGEIAWRQRGIAQPNIVFADGKLIMLDSEGKLMLATTKEDGIDVKGEAQLLEKPSWTAPTVVGTKAYIRDRKMIMAVDLSGPQAVSLKGP
jgi:outer membrane protein assembly factor BamB